MIDITTLWNRDHPHLFPMADSLPLASEPLQTCGACGHPGALKVLAHVRFGGDRWLEEREVIGCPQCRKWWISEDQLPAELDEQPTAVDARLWSRTPTVLNIEPTTRCNFNCWYCVGRHMEQKDITVEDFKRVLDHFPSVRLIALVGEGEPLMHKGFYEMARMAADRGIRVVTLSNGSTLSTSNVQKLCEARIHYISISIDSHDADTFASSRINGDLHQVLAGIKRLADYRDAHGFKYPRIGLKGSLFSHTQDQIPQIVALAQAHGVEIFESFQPLNPMQTYVPIYPVEKQAELESERLNQVIAAIQRDSNDALQQLKPVSQFCEEEGIAGSNMGKPNKLRPNCDEEWIYSLLSGDVTPCCQIKTPISQNWNLVQHSMEEILADHLYENTRFNLWNGLFPMVCKGCYKTRAAADAPVSIVSNEPSNTAILAKIPDYKNFSFPLNVYSHILHFDFGGFDYLHYGIYEEGQTNIIVAQKHSSELLASRLPPPPCRLLDVGIGLGTTLAKLLQAGYEAIGITPDSHQIEVAFSLHGEGLPVACIKYEDFNDAKPFDVILFQESAQYIDAKTIFQKASGLLKQNGRIIIMDEVSLRKDSPSGPGLPLLDGYLSLGEQFGFDLQEQLDLTALASPTNDYIHDSVIRNYTRLIQHLDLAPTEIDSLLESIKAYSRKYKERLYGYCLLTFKKKPAIKAQWLAEWAHPEHEGELLALFKRAFGTEMTETLWRWKYAGLDPQGALTRRDGRVVAFYGSIPRKVELFGSPEIAVQISDVMVDPDERGVLRRSGPFSLAAEHYISHYVGKGKRFLFGFGFPSQRAYRLGERLGLYAKAGEIMRVEWIPMHTRFNLLLRTRPLDNSMGTSVDRLWLEMAAALSRQIVGVRDFVYLKRRYLEHPTLNYRVYMVSHRLGNKPYGIIVVREEGDELLWVDMVAPPERVAELVTIVRRLASDLGKPRTYAWITAQHAALFAGESGVISPTEIVIPALDWNPAIHADQLNDRWWLMAGDTDFR